MEVPEEAMGSKNIFKGKRTKRQRSMSPFLLTMTTATTSSCSSGEAIGGGVFGDLSPYSSGSDRVTPSPSNSGELTQSSVEEDMANCLILLAQGQSQNLSQPASFVITNSTKSADHDVYQCKTCNRCFPSFQALGGHRASHKKPKQSPEEKNNDLFLGHQETVRLIKDNDTTLSLQITSNRDLCSQNNNKSRVHECSICGAEFTSGQALGGHMRRHRPLPVVPISNRNDEGFHKEAKNPRTQLSLDLNLPASDQSEDDHLLESEYPFASKGQVIVCSASHSLVDCHY